MHSNRMLHLDLKPTNIMMRDGHAVLIDFGLSKQYNEKGDPESSTTIGRGTKGYAPLEQSDYQDGKGFPVTMDVYALGGTVYKMLTGKRPPEASDILNDGFPTADLQGVGVSPWLVSLTEKCMNPMRNGRYQTVAEVLSVLTSNSPQEVIIGEPVYPPDSEETVLGEQADPKPRVNVINGHEYVDLGLSIKWATCNVGANSPSDYGDYFAWGETSPKSVYTEKNSATLGKGNMPDIAGDASHDAARANWGSTWRLPTKADIDELVSKCQRTLTTVGGQKGYRVIGPNGYSIFLPAAGYRYRETRYDAGDYGNYWSATPNESYTQDACEFFFDSGYFRRCYASRYCGRSVRPVSD